MTRTHQTLGALCLVLLALAAATNSSAQVPETTACAPNTTSAPKGLDKDGDGIPAQYVRGHTRVTVDDDGSVTTANSRGDCWVGLDPDDDGAERVPGAEPPEGLVGEASVCAPNPSSAPKGLDKDGDGIPAQYVRKHTEYTLHEDGTVEVAGRSGDCWVAGDPDDAVVRSPFVVVPATTVRFILAGDTGTGSAAQYKVAAAIEEVCAARSCDFMAILGDLIYEHGVTSADDPQFVTKFERPYERLGFPIYTVLGNHDLSNDPYLGDLAPEEEIGHWYEAGSHQVAYHYRTDRLSEKWQMPDRYYSFRYGDAEFFALDTNTMMYANIPTGSTRAAAYESALTQSAWFDAAVASSDAKWKFAMGHHPYVSNGLHGDAGHYDDEDQGEPLGEQATPVLAGDGVKLFFDGHLCPSGEIDLYFAGHDHDLQWLKPVDSCGATEFIVSGAGSKSRALEESPAQDSWYAKGSTLGFFWVEIAGGEFHAVVFDSNGDQLYERTLVDA